MSTQFLFNISIEKNGGVRNRKGRGSEDGEWKRLAVVCSSLENAIAAVKAKYPEWMLTSVDIDREDEVLFAD